ncbi:precorrin-6Y C5,15-methyltransferase (decarboxylating) [Pseudoduganella flava]|uniref:Precorrin-6Y C5,15-methyltransferase (Decarboxylating) n=1 Tax=Pseudoduganella flava TaxID=871742 RepID=A0A562Q0V1_9BURK|nr:precorrin-6y C5,15-methyltransferase (decarboxylating) subunit CbiE [Pseudoduganella flava]QGZ38177.1 precorrin-6y C5,15-methyltransferase (decarboxylating) subunit CbiE [Pseudoduganella flava]TWI50299.1 precorrin-6Y C5,15-methyltransferase (decarboxylating) [Pseudoduganella flava]
MTDPNPCRVIGVLDDGVASLSADARAYLRNADVVIGGSRTLALFKDATKPGATLLDLTGKLSAVPEWIRNARADHLACVVLATGDPLCHGIAPYLAQHVCIDALDIVPNVSTLQLACARVGLAWQDARIVSVHARDAGEWERGALPTHGLYALAQAVRAHARLLILTSPDNSPARIARLLLAEGLGDDFHMAVAENLLQPEERVLADLRPADAVDMSFAPLNVVLLWRTAPAPRPVRFGLADDTFVQRQPDKGLITKQEVRAVSLARLQLREDSIVWDIGAGSGSVGLEAARLCPRGHVFAIEKNEADHAITGRNHAAFGVSNYTLRHGRAPDGLDAWPDPDAVFIGGSGGELAELIALISRRLRPGGTLVMNFVTLENLAAATAALQDLAPQGVQWDVVQLQAARSKPILHMHRMAAENPVWIVCAEVPLG